MVTPEQRPDRHAAIAAHSMAMMIMKTYSWSSSTRWTARSSSSIVRAWIRRVDKQRSMNMFHFLEWHGVLLGVSGVLGFRVMAHIGCR